MNVSKLSRTELKSLLNAVGRDFTCHFRSLGNRFEWRHITPDITKWPFSTILWYKALYHINRKLPQMESKSIKNGLVSLLWDSIAFKDHFYPTQIDKNQFLTKLDSIHHISWRKWYNALYHKIVFFADFCHMTHYNKPFQIARTESKSLQNELKSSQNDLQRLRNSL